MARGEQRLRVIIPGENHWRQVVSCQAACPVRTDARSYVRAIAAGRFEEAYLIARGPNPLASICGRVCGAPCEEDCRRGKIPRLDPDGRFIANDKPIAIRALKRFACERDGWTPPGLEELFEAYRRYVPALVAEPEELAAVLQAEAAGRFKRADGERIAVIGSGPAGLGAAHDLALMGFRPVVFEAESVPGGMLAIGVPTYRLPRPLITAEIEVIRALGVEFRCAVKVGEDISFAKIREEFPAVIVAVGAKASRALQLPGERGPGVYGGVDFLRQVFTGSPPPVGSSVVVIGGGNVAYDVARTVLRQITCDVARTAARLPQKPQVRLVSLETVEEMPADTEEILEGDEEGIERINGWGPVSIERESDGSVKGVWFRRCLRAYDDSGRFNPVFDDSERRFVPCRTVLLAVGQAPDTAFLREGGEDIEEFRPGWPKVDPDTLSTTAPGVFVAGDLAHGTKLLIDAIASGKHAARSVYTYLTGRSITMEETTNFDILPLYRRERGYEALRRVPVPKEPPEVRLQNPEAIVERGYSTGEALREASRCLDCAVSPIFDGTRCVLCGGCIDVCPTACLKLVSLSEIEGGPELERLLEGDLGSGFDPERNSAIVKDEDRCIRCGLCAMRCPSDAITMERVCGSVVWRSS